MVKDLRLIIREWHGVSPPPPLLLLSLQTSLHKNSRLGRSGPKSFGLGSASGNKMASRIHRSMGKSVDMCPSQCL